MRKTVITIGLCLLAVSAYGVQTIQLKGIFGSKAAVLVIDGQREVVKLNQTVEGVTLLKVNKKDVQVRYNDQLHTIALSRQIGAAYKVPVVNTVRLARQKGGHYWTQVSLDGVQIPALIDTGATAITINFSTAKKLGINYQEGKTSKVSTANGVVAAKEVVLDQVTIGSIKERQVSAVVLMDDSLEVTLLGNSFLSRVGLQTEDGVMILTQKR